MGYRHLDLFAGIGGFSLAAMWMNWQTIAYCEIDPYCQQILRQHLPHATGHTDIRNTDFSIYGGGCDIVTGGFPCQPVSQIGEQRGTADPRYMWPDFRRAYQQAKPVWIVPENVRGLVTWNDGQLFEQICKDMEDDGYEVWPFLLPASGYGAGHQRERIFIVAHSAKRRLERGKLSTTQGQWQTENGPVPALVEDRNWTEHAKSFIHGGVYGLPDRVDRTKALGNAIYPQIAYQIFKAIELFEQCG